MRRNFLSSGIVFIVFIFLFVAGCQEQFKEAQAAETAALSASKAKAPAETKDTSETEPAAPAATKVVTAKKQQVISKPTTGAAEIKVLNPVHDFGNMGPGVRKVCEFKFKNVGDAVLKIKKIQVTCGCTVPKLKKKEYAPGETGIITVKFFSPKSEGAIKKSLYIESNASKTPKVRLTVKANVVLMVSYEPKKLKLLLNKDNAGCETITIKSLDDKEFSIKSFRSRPDCITADYDTSVKSKHFVLKPEVDMTKLKKNLNGTVSIRLTHPQCSVITIPFSTLATYKVNPPSIIIFNATAQTPVLRDVWLLSNYDEDFEIESTSTTKGYIKVLKEEKVGSRYKFEIQITPPLPDGKKNVFTDEFIINIKDGEKIQVRCRGFYPRNKKVRSATKKSR